MRKGQIRFSKTEIDREINLSHQLKSKTKRKLVLLDIDEMKKAKQNLKRDQSLAKILVLLKEPKFQLANCEQQ